MSTTLAKFIERGIVMQPTDDQFDRILQQICEQQGGKAAQYLQTQAAMLEGRDEKKRKVFLQLLDKLREKA